MLNDQNEKNLSRFYFDGLRCVFFKSLFLYILPQITNILNHFISYNFSIPFAVRFYIVPSTPLTLKVAFTMQEGKKVTIK